MAADMKKGHYIVLEGIDGTGKSTISRTLISEHPDWECTMEPRNPEKTVSAAEGRSPIADVLLFAADRVEHMKDIKEFIESGRTILSDRSFYSSMAYQATAMKDSFGGIEEAISWVREVNRPFVIQPDAVILLDMPAGKSLSRLASRDEITRFEKEEYLESVRHTYLILAQRHNFHIVDAEKPLENVISDCREIIEGL